MFSSVRFVLNEKTASPLVVFISEPEVKHLDLLNKICASVRFLNFEIKKITNSFNLKDLEVLDQQTVNWIFVFDENTKSTMVETHRCFKILKTFSLKNLDQDQNLKANLWKVLKETTFN